MITDQETRSKDLRHDGRHVLARERRQIAPGERWCNPPYSSYPFDFLCQEKRAKQGKCRKVFRARVWAVTSSEASALLAIRYSPDLYRSVRIDHHELTGLPIVTITKSDKDGTQ